MKSNPSLPVLPENKLEKIFASLVTQGIGRPDCAVILGSGLGHFTSALQDRVSIPYSEIPGFTDTNVIGHDGILYFGTLLGRKVLAWSGRFHLYEGHPIEQTILPVQVSKKLGCPSLIATNAAGGINERFQVGDLMLIDDIISLPAKVSPFRQPLQKCYDNGPVVSSAVQLAIRSGIPVRRGCYLYTKGPNYETKSEIRAFKKLGADAVGMSTASELNEAVRLDMTCIGISLITNKAAGSSKKKLDHSEIKDVATLRKKEFNTLVTQLISNVDSPLRQPDAMNYAPDPE